MKQYKVGVYGTLRKGFGNHHYMSGSPQIAEGVIKGYTMRASGIPFVHPGDGEVYVEVYSVDETDMPDIDALEGHPRWYKREIVPVHTSDGIVEAWVYLMPERLVDDVQIVESGNYSTYVNERYK